MVTLFEIPPTYPEGFSYFPDFIAHEEEQYLLNLIARFELHPFAFNGFKANRKVSSFGYDYIFDNGSLSKGSAIPGVFDFLIEKVSQHLQMDAEAFAELLLTEYAPGTVINWHRDAPPFGIVAGISLQSDCVFKLRRHEPEKHSRKHVVSLTVQRRSLYVLQGVVRNEWQHSIAPVKERRYSITLRTLKPDQKV